MVMGRERRTFAARGKVRLAEGRGGRGSGRRSRLQVSCRTAFEKRIEAKKSQSSNSSTGLRSTPIDVGKKKGKSDNRRNKLREKNVKADGTSSNQGKASKATPAQTKTTAVSSSQPGKAVVASQQKKTASEPPAKKAKAKAQGLRFQHDFGFGEQGPHVERLQRILLSEKYLTSRDQITGYFGRETKEAMAMWQKKNKVMASGYFGPVSRAVINKQGKLTRAKQAVAVQLVVNPVGTSAVSFSLAGIVAVSLLYLIRSKQDAGRSWLQKVAGVAENCIAYASGLQLLSFLDPNSNNTRGPQLEAASAVYKEEEERERFDAKTKRQFPGLATRNNKGEGGEQPSGREMYSQRVELRRNIASLQNELGYAEDQLKKATFLLRREKERADRAESLYLEEKSSAQLLQMENQKLKNALKTSGRR
jgi:peptidoglycan hydrolase-like protein with peptidoglycan-binding domain